MSILQEIMDINEEDLENYIINRVTLLDATCAPVTIMDAGEASLVDGWVNSKSMFLPSGFRRKGFNLDSRKLYLDYIKFLRTHFGDVDLQQIEEAIILFATNTFLIEQFDSLQFDSEKRNLLFAQTPLLAQYQNKIDIINVEELFNKGIIRCIEKSAISNNLMNFIGIHSSIVLCMAKHNKNEAVGHAFNMVILDGQHTLFDASFYARTTDGGAYPVVIEVGDTTLQKDVWHCNIGEYATTLGNDKPVPNQGNVTYTFPSVAYCEINNIGINKSH